MLVEDTKVAVSGYDFLIPKNFADPEIRESDSYTLMKSAAANDVSFDIFVMPGAGDQGIDGYFGSALRRFEDGQPKGFDLEHMGQKFRGWRIDNSLTLSEDPTAFVQFYGTVANGDAVCFSWAYLGGGETTASEDQLENLFLTIVFAGISRRMSLGALNRCQPSG